MYSPVRRKQHRSEYSDSGSDLNQIELVQGWIQKDVQGPRPCVSFYALVPLSISHFELFPLA